MSKKIRTMNRRRDNFLDFDQFTVRFKRGDYRKCFFLVLHFTFGMQIRQVVTYKTSHFARAFSYAPIKGMPAGRGEGRRGMGWGFDCLCWPWGRALD